MSQRYSRTTFLTGLWVLAFLLETHAATIEQYLLVFPLQPEPAQTQSNVTFGKAFRDVVALGALAWPTLVFLKDDELAALIQEYQLEKEINLPKLEQLADEKEIGLLYGTYSQEQQNIRLHLYIIQGPNQVVQTVDLNESLQTLRKLFQIVFKKIVETFELTGSEQNQKMLERVPGTDAWQALQYYYQAIEILRPNPENPALCLQASPWLDQALAVDPEMVPALAMRATCRILAQTMAPSVKDQKKYLALAQTDIQNAQKLEPENPLLLTAQSYLGIVEGNYVNARSSAEKNWKLYPTYYTNYLLLGRIYRHLNLPEAAEKILLQGLEQQGSELAKKPFYLELGLLLLQRDDKNAEFYFNQCLLLDPQNAYGRYLHATTLFRLQRFSDAMQEIQAAESIKTWPQLQALKAQTALLLGHTYFEEGNFEQADTFAKVALNLQSQHFETLMLMAKILRKKELIPKALHHLELAQKVVRPDHPRDHLELGTEFIALGKKILGAQEYERYLQLDPQAPESRRLQVLIQELYRGEASK